MAKQWKRMASAAVWVALIWLAAACTDPRQIPADAPSVNPAATSSSSAAAPASATTRSRISTPESSPGPSASASAEAQPTTSPQSSSKAPDKRPTTAQPKPGSPQTAKPAAPSPSPSTVANDITISVVGNAEWGNVVAAEKIALKKQDTVADLLIRTLKTHKLAFEKRGSGALFYVVGIDGLYEFDDGPTSGWKFRVNGKEPGVGAGSVEPKPGDRVEWIYTSEDADAKEKSDSKGSKP